MRRLAIQHRRIGVGRYAWCQSHAERLWSQRSFVPGVIIVKPFGITPSWTAASRTIWLGRNQNPRVWCRNWQYKSLAQSLCTTGFSAILLPPAIFLGLAVSLWFYKCLMMVIFQDKIIYMPGIPLFARAERLVDYAQTCWPVVWREKRIVVDDGTEIALCIGDMDSQDPASASQASTARHVIILYFQG